MKSTKTTAPITNEEEMKPPEGYPKSISEAYEMIKEVILSGDQKLIDKAWKVLNEGKGDWPWVRVMFIQKCWEAADAVGREEFMTIALQRHIDEGNAIALAEIFTDETTGIEYQEYLMCDLTICRVPIATKEMDKYAYEKALNKMFLWDFIKTSSSDGTNTYTLLDTQEKVDAYNAGTYYDDFVWHTKSRRKRSNNRNK